MTIMDMIMQQNRDLARRMDELSAQIAAQAAMLTAMDEMLTDIETATQMTTHQLRTT